MRKILLLLVAMGSCFSCAPEEYYSDPGTLAVDIGPPEKAIFIPGELMTIRWSPSGDASSASVGGVTKTDFPGNIVVYLRYVGQHSQLDTARGSIVVWGGSPAGGIAVWRVGQLDYGSAIPGRYWLQAVHYSPYSAPGEGAYGDSRTFEITK